MTQRRDILRTCLRGGGLLVLGGVASVLGWRTPQGTCPHGDPCGGCPSFPGCGLPKALQSKSTGTATPNPPVSNTKAVSRHA